MQSIDIRIDQITKLIRDMMVEDDSMNFTTEQTIIETSKSILLIEVSRLTSTQTFDIVSTTKSSINFRHFQSIEILLLICIFLEQLFLFILSCRTRHSKQNETEINSRSLLLPSKSFLYSCLHRNWIRVYSLGNLCLSLAYFFAFFFKIYRPKSIDHSEITFYLLLFHLTEQILINFSSFHLLIISISVGQYFLRYERLVKNSYSRHFFNGQSPLITKHTNVALILSGSLALIFAYNSTFYIPRSDRETSVLPLVTFNMILLPLINFFVLFIILLCLLKIICGDHSSIDEENENETLRLLIAKSSCTKCYEKILEKNARLFQDKEHPYADLYRKFSLTQIRRSICPLTWKGERFFSMNFLSHQNSTDNEHQFFRSTIHKLNLQHRFCHLTHHLLLIFMLKYSLLTSPIYLDQMYFYLKDFYVSLVGPSRRSESMKLGFYDTDQRQAMIYHCLFLLSRLGDCFLLTRFPLLIKKYFPCWCQCNTKICQRKQNENRFIPKRSESSNNENSPNFNVDSPSIQIEVQQENLRKLSREKHRRRFRLRFQYVPLWSHHRTNSFPKTL